MYYPPNPYGYQPPEDMVYHPRYGYLSRKKLGRKQIRAELNWLSAATTGMFVFSLVVGVFLGIYLVAFGIFVDFERYPDSSGMPPYLYHMLSCVISAVGTGLPFALYLAIRRPRLSEYIKTEKNGFGTGLLFVLAGAGICLAANYPAVWVGNLVEAAGMTAEVPNTFAAPDPVSAVIYFVSIAIMPPLFEEFAFRGIMLSALRKYGDAFALVVSSILFGLMHMNVSSIVFAVICGFAMGYVYLRTGNIWLNVAIHFMNNAQAAAGQLLYQYLPEETAAWISNLMFFGIMLAGVISLIILAVRGKLGGRFFAGPEKETGAFIPASSKFAAFITSPIVLLLVGICLFYTVASMLGAIA